MIFLLIRLLSVMINFDSTFGFIFVCTNRDNVKFSVYGGPILKHVDFHKSTWILQCSIFEI